MEALRKPKATIIYEGKDITADVAEFLLDLTYTDKVEGESDEIELRMEDSDGLWRGEWYPTKGDKMKVSIGYENSLMIDCGTFEIDETEMEGPPDVVTIRGIAAGIKKALRTKGSKAYESQTLKQIAQSIAAKHGYTVEGEIKEIKFARITQHQEGDLAFLRRVAEEYGYLFSIRDTKLVFTSMFDIEKGQPVIAIDRTELAQFSIRDKTSQTFRSAVVKYQNPTDKTVVEFEQKENLNADGKPVAEATAEDVLVVNTKAENRQQAEAKAKAALWRANSRQQEGSISVEGNPILVAGNNIELTGLGQVSGKYQIRESRHTIARGSGYTTSCQLKRVGYVEAVKQKSTKKRTPNVKYQVIS